MEKKKGWQFALIIIVVVLTLYNIFPTILFYVKPINHLIGVKEAKVIADGALARVNALEFAAIDWLKSYNKLLKIRPSAITLSSENPQFIHIRYNTIKDAKTLRKHLPRAGVLIPFVPAQLSVLDEEKEQDPLIVTIQRNIPIHFDANQVDDYFTFTFKREENGSIAPLYREVVQDRLVQIGLAVGGTSENAQYLDTILFHKEGDRFEEFLQILSQNILTYARVFGENSPIAKRYYTTFTQAMIEDKGGAIDQLIHSFERYRDRIKLEISSLQDMEKKREESGGFLETQEQQHLQFLKEKEENFSSTLRILRCHSSIFSAGPIPWTYMKIKQDISLKNKENHTIQSLQVGHLSPLINLIHVDWNNERIDLELHSDIETYKREVAQFTPHLSPSLEQLIYNEIARIHRITNETLTPYRDGFSVYLNSLTNSQSLLVLNIGSIAEKQEKQLIHLIKTHWNPTHPDLVPSSFPLYDYKTFMTLPAPEKKIGLVVYAPSQFETQPMAGFKASSIYVIAKGVQEILHKFEEDSASPQARAFIQDFTKLRDLLQKNGFYAYPGATHPLGTDFIKDFIFEGENFYRNILQATHEDFFVHGTNKYATLEFTNVEQRILTLNRIETKQQEDLLKWRDEYRSAQVSTNEATKLDIPAPTRNPLFSNFLLSLHKYFRGDNRKILHWGLDLSGGKTVQIQLRDTHNKVVTNNVDIKQGINELYKRVNKMGVSEVAIRQEGANITLDFPSAQGLSSADLVKASSMYFHIVNEKFTPHNVALAPAVNKFLQEIWNEAVVTNRKDIDSINQIAWKHLYGDIMDADKAQPLGGVARMLYDQGLRLSPPDSTFLAHEFNDAVSKIAIFRGENFADWQGQTTPLLIVMRNYALEGSNLTNVHSAYDPAKGNFLSFQVKGSQTLSDGQKLNPRNGLYHWTSAFSKEKIQGTPLGQITQGRGSRMAVILNGSIISVPTIESPLRDNVSISGNFTQREANRLEADLKAGSLSFTPHILSEKNVSPELGIKDRTMGIVATIIALMLVILVMVGYYRFGGVIASIAVLFNLLIIWAALQNISATVTLAGIAGIILTVGIAVDANVLVFERIREEFSVSGRLAQAVHAGYRKTFSAILDSNVTTIIAALILLHFDSGPIKGFAVTLIIGIISSMFTALFMTRYFFMGWVQNPKNKVLKMANIIKGTSINFLKHSRMVFGGVITVALVGGYLFIVQRDSIFGMDFTGGYSLSLEVEPQANTSYRNLVEKALIKGGIPSQDIRVRELTPANNIKILIGKSLAQMGQSFFNVPFKAEVGKPIYPYQNNPYLVWIVDTLQKFDVHLTPHSLQNLDNTWASISGQMSRAMRDNAIIGLSLALICILFYITFRFEFKYAISATLGLAIDVIMTAAIISILHFLKVPIQIDLNTIAATMTIIGYSLNDTIIIFDRIREDVKFMRKHSFRKVVNHALNLTLSRTIMTSTTTLVVLFVLLFLGGSATFALSLIMVVGVIFGTFSSLFIAAPLLSFFHKKEELRMNKISLNEN